ncbi:MAG: hypothetical protein SPI18_03060 [Prevotella sp.]|nr:hypothetical protein [Prevotella sp.]
MPVAFPFGTPLYVMLKPAGASCNLQCNVAIAWKRKSSMPMELGECPKDRFLNDRYGNFVA